MPVLFVGHGSPMNGIEDNAFARDWREDGRTLPSPKAILCVSAHWQTAGTQVTAMDRAADNSRLRRVPARTVRDTVPGAGSATRLARKWRRQSARGSVGQRVGIGPRLLGRAAADVPGGGHPRSSAQPRLHPGPLHATTNGRRGARRGSGERACSSSAAATWFTICAESN